MVIYDLVCSNQHLFEGWFKSKDIGKTTRQQLPAVEADSKSVNSANNTEPAALEGRNLHFSNAPETLEMLRSYVEKNFEDVGNEFSEETRKMH